MPYHIRCDKKSKYVDGEEYIEPEGEISVHEYRGDCCCSDA
jgi:hypothetical protein